MVGKSGTDRQHCRLWASVQALGAIGEDPVIPEYHKSSSAKAASVFDATISSPDDWEADRAASAHAGKLRAKFMADRESLGFAFAIDRGIAAACPG